MEQADDMNMKQQSTESRCARIRGDVTRLVEAVAVSRYVVVLFYLPWRVYCVLQCGWSGQASKNAKNGRDIPKQCS